MAAVSCLLLLVSFMSTVDSYTIPSDYNTERNNLINSEKSMRVGGKLVLNPQEQLVNQFIVKEKRQLMDCSRLNRTGYAPAVSFFQSKSWIESTPIFKIIQKMPKGASLHLHDLAIASLDWVIKNATYRDNVYMCTDKTYYIQLSVFKNPPNNPDCPWKSVRSERSSSGNNQQFDLRLKRNISLLTTDPLVTYPTVDIVWDRFNAYFAQVIGILSYAPITRDYYRQALVEFKADNVQYIELRAQLHGLYDLDGTVYDPEYALNLYKNVTEEFVRDNPDFSGAKIIMSSLRLNENSNILNDIKTSMTLYTKYPDFFLGFDLVGQEDPNHPLIYYINTLLYPSQQNPPFNLPYFFHAAETKWQGTESDYNLVDALLLNTTRIGHGYGLVKHPLLVEMIKERGVAVEVNPLSNQILGLVSDLRNHAIAPLISQDIPVVISSDDPSTWEALPLTHDMYVAFMDLTGEDADLAILKQLIQNSLNYSVLNQTESTSAFKLWQAAWDKFISDTINTWNLVNGGRQTSQICEVLKPVTTQISGSATSLKYVHIIFVIPMYILLSHAYIFLTTFIFL